MSATDYATEETTILSRFDANWDSASYPVAWDNTVFEREKAAADAWVRFTVRPGGADQITMGPSGQRDFRHDGLAFCQVFVREQTGPGLASQLADTAMGIFRGVSADGVIYDPPPYKQVVGMDGDWFQVNAIIPYRRDSSF